MNGKERGRKERKRKRQNERETLSGVVEQEGGLRGTAPSVQLKNQNKQKILELNNVSNV